MRPIVGMFIFAILMVIFLHLGAALNAAVQPVYREGLTSMGSPSATLLRVLLPDFLLEILLRVVFPMLAAVASSFGALKFSI